MAILAGEIDQDEDLVYQQNSQPSLFSLEAVQDSPVGGRANFNTYAKSGFYRPRVLAGTPGRFAFSIPLVSSSGSTSEFALD